eukprot:1051671-Pleurochrysis_carterae.AAC.3
MDTKCTMQVLVTSRMAGTNENYRYDTLPPPRCDRRRAALPSRPRPAAEPRAAAPGSAPCSIAASLALPRSSRRPASPSCACLRTLFQHYGRT